MLAVKVVRVNNLFPKHSRDSASAFVVLTFHGQQFRTSTKFKDMSPAWNESFHFDMPDQYNHDELVLEASVYGLSVQSSRSLLGKVRHCVSRDSMGHVMYYRLQKNGMFSREARGVLGLKVCITDEASIRTQAPKIAALRLYVQVVSAHGLMPMDEQGSASTFVELSFDYAQFRTAAKDKDLLNPLWNERFCFDVWDPSSLPTLVLEACVYNVNKNKYTSGCKSFLGKVRLNSYSFLSYSDNAATSYHPLQRSGMFSHGVTGALCLRVYITSEPPNAASNPICFPQLHVSNKLESILQNKSSEPQAVSFKHLKKITNNFSAERIIGQGAVGVVYKGVLNSGEMVAVKKILSSWVPGSKKQFENEVCHLMMLKHPNIVRFVGYCYETRNLLLEYNGVNVFAESVERLLCLEYLPKGSLDKYLSDESSGLDWSTRYSIIMGICYGLCHLHEKVDKPVIHLDIKPANILLDECMVPKITDFGLSRELGEQTIETSSRSGTFGYMAPEFIRGGTITPKSDIFSLGVIIVEVVTGRKPDFIEKSPHEIIELTLTKWRNILLRSPRNGSLEMHCKQIKRCIQVGLICVNLSRAKRPAIGKVIRMLQGSESIDCNLIGAAMQYHYY